MFIDETDEPLLKLGFSSNEAMAFFICVAGVLSVGFLKGVFEFIFSLSAGL